MHDLSQTAFRLDPIEEWLAGDDRTLAFQVVDANGDPVDIEAATVEWSLYSKPYHDDASQAVLSGSDSGVELVTDSRVDTSSGQWEVRVDGEATADIYGEYYHRPAVAQQDGTRASWVGEAVVTA